MYYNGCLFTKNPSQALSGKNIKHQEKQIASNDLFAGILVSRKSRHAKRTASHHITQKTQQTALRKFNLLPYIQGKPEETFSKRKVNLAPASLFPSRQPAQNMGKEKLKDSLNHMRKLPAKLEGTSETALNLPKLSWDTRWAPVKASIKAAKPRSATAKMYHKHSAAP